ncbi:MAG: trypsin-like peptidase domain-containing protein [Planctomycetales bacterium]|nr:trypsin-like peptidase domain-containing protein [Planctomycetales bacterium]
MLGSKEVPSYAIWAESDSMTEENDPQGPEHGENRPSYEAHDLTDVEISGESNQAADESAIPAWKKPVLLASQSENDERIIYGPSYTASMRFLISLCVAGGFLLALRYLVPFVVEEVQYAKTRGRQRAEYELAGQQLEQTSLRTLSDSYELIMQRIAPSVVHIKTSRISDMGEMHRQMGLPNHPEVNGMGSGVIMSADGKVMTNYHVIEGVEEVDVLLSDDRPIPAKVIAVDPANDLAVLQVSQRNLIAAEWADSDVLNEGALVWAIGSPFGLTRTITSGIVSSKSRTQFGGRAIQDFIQTDVALNPGNSGGPLVNVDGKVVGINTGIIGEPYKGISFAIPGNLARNAFDDMMNGRIKPSGYLGIRMSQITVPVADRLGLPEVSGVLVLEVRMNRRSPTPAEQAGLQVGDVVLSWDGAEVASPVVLGHMVAQTPIGSQVTMEVWREGQVLSLPVVVAERPLQLN